MPFLPLDNPEPFSATLGVMHYPAVDEADPPKARAYAAQLLAAAFKRLLEGGGTLPRDVTDILLDAGQPLTDLKERQWGGRATGELFKTFFALANTDPALASWKHAIEIVVSTTKGFSVKGRRTKLLEAKDRFLTVAHLWAARSIREGKSFLNPEVGYDATADFQSFLTEAEIIRKWGQTWRAGREKSEPPLPQDLWRVPDDWEPPPRKPGWPPTGMIPAIKVPEELLAGLRPAGRPRG